MFHYGKIIGKKFINPDWMCDMKNREDNLVRRADGKVIGIINNFIFTKHISGKKHFVRIPPGIANDVDVLKSIEKRGVILVEIIDDDTQKRYYATLKTIWEKGQPINRGFGNQWLLLFRNWSNIMENAHDPEVLAKQPKLF